ncbi:helix-turn-helix domain-containing protein [Blastococcus haudaquaticus]|uniref:Helix-turn-helix n=1 Tax=Blastococcus haudaquaticus TaxID=1938745 RepID=A0A286GTC1_9ACTN|nr:helix-turn-helix domain-containing protein [Blastococcus haudaquaticus]SOD98760.1 Helix-turn-helix [Blastococcus haudaquaticus]
MGDEPLGALIRRLRLDADLTLERLSEASGISDRALSDIERGAARGPQHRTVVAIAAALGVGEIERAAMFRAARDGRRRTAPPARLPLPPAVADFVGRDAELARTTAALASPGDLRPPLTVITGPPGYGKTSLAVRAAASLRDRFPEQLFLRLGGCSPEPLPAEAVAFRIIRALTGRAGSDPHQVRQVLADRRVLLVLDDTASEAQVRKVFPSRGPAAVLVTSRRSLAGLDGAQRVPVDRLPRADALRLLAGAIPTEQRVRADLSELARLCDDVPLALRIAANRVASHPALTVAGLAARLNADDRRMAALTAGDVSMAAAIRPSVTQLSPGAQLLFRRLAAAAGPVFNSDLAACLLSAPLRRAEELLDELVDSSLVQPAAGDRYGLADLLRSYARAELPQEPARTHPAVPAPAGERSLTTAHERPRPQSPAVATAEPSPALSAS